MAESKHTPGPYIEHGTAIYAATMQDIDHEHYRGFDHIERGAPGYLIAESIPHGPTRKLLTAAPDLLEALKALCASDEPMADDDLWQAAEEALAKAEGRA